jgi:hypothetical protein
VHRSPLLPAPAPLVVGNPPSDRDLSLVKPATSPVITRRARNRSA